MTNKKPCDAKISLYCKPVHSFGAQKGVPHYLQTTFKKVLDLGLEKKNKQIYIYICAFVIATVVVHGIANDMLFQDTPNITFITS